MQTASLRRSWVALAALLSGCEAATEPAIDESDDDEPLGTTRQAISVAEAAASSCTTTSVKGLSEQIIARAACIEPDAYTLVPSRPNLSFGSAVFAFMVKPARDRLIETVDANPNKTMTVNSMLRTVAQQYLLYRWYQNGECGIGLAATPGNSNHETGLAIDTSQYDAWKPALQNNGFQWLGANDPVHFDYVGPGAVNYAGLDVLAFQKLWNENHPNDLIDEDGAYGPQTESRLKQSPAEGFAMPVVCGPPPKTTADVFLTLDLVGAEDRFDDGPSMGVSDYDEGDRGTLALHVENRGATAAGKVVLSVELDPAFEAVSLVLERGPSANGPFEADPALGAPGNPSPTAPPATRFDLDLGALEPNEHKRLTVQFDANDYTADRASLATLRTWVSQVDDLYSAPTFGGDVTNVDGSQTFGGGRLELERGADVYSRTRWEWDSARFEGATAAGVIVLDPPLGGALAWSGGDPDAGISTPSVDVDFDGGATIRVRGTRSAGEGEAALYVLRDADDTLASAERYALEWPVDAPLHDMAVEVSPGRIARVVVVPFSAGGGSGSLDRLAIDAGAIGGGGGGGGGDAGDGDAPGTGLDCSCRTGAFYRASDERPAWFALGLGLALAAARRLRRR